MIEAATGWVVIGIHIDAAVVGESIVAAESHTESVEATVCREVAEEKETLRWNGCLVSMHTGRP